MNNNEIIQETYKLPSLGKLNNIKDSVTLRPMTTDEELLRLDATGREANRVFCDIIDACVVEPKKFKSYYLPIQDQVFLLYKLRTVTYGSKYNVSLICPHCGSPITLDVDLDSLPINYIEEEEFRKINEYTLPKTGDHIKQKILTPALQDDIDSALEDKKEKLNRPLKPSEVVLERLCLRIAQVNGETMIPEMVKNYLRGLSAVDFQTIKTHDVYLKTFGIQTAGIKTRCPQCMLEFKFALPLTKEFFEPEYL